MAKLLTTFAAAIALCGAATAPLTSVAAQDATLSREGLHTAYALTMMCLEASSAMASKAERDGDTATLEKLTQDAPLWMGVAKNFGEQIGIDVDKDIERSVARILAEDSLFGPDVAYARQKQVFDACQPFLGGPK